MTAGKITITFAEEGSTPASFEIPAVISAKVQQFVDDVDPDGSKYGHSKAMLFLLHNKSTLLDPIEAKYPDLITPEVQALIDQRTALEAQIAAAKDSPVIVPVTLMSTSTGDFPVTTP
jgi:hypothetical protein